MPFPKSWLKLPMLTIPEKKFSKTTRPIPPLDTSGFDIVNKIILVEKPTRILDIYSNAQDLLDHPTMMDEQQFIFAHSKTLFTVGHGWKFDHPENLYGGSFVRVDGDPSGCGKLIEIWIPGTD